MTFPYMDWNNSLVVDHFACSAIDRGFKSWFDHYFAVLFESVPNRISVRPAAGCNAAAGGAAAGGAARRSAWVTLPAPPPAARVFV